MLLLDSAERGTRSGIFGIFDFLRIHGISKRTVICLFIFFVIACAFSINLIYMHSRVKKRREIFEFSHQDKQNNQDPNWKQHDNPSGNNQIHDNSKMDIEKNNGNDGNSILLDSTVGGSSSSSSSGSSGDDEKNDNDIIKMSNSMNVKKRKSWMQIVMPTVSRNGNIDYLTDTLNSLLLQVSLPKKQRTNDIQEFDMEPFQVPDMIQLHIFNHNLKNVVHSSFETWKKRIQNDYGANQQVIQFISSNAEQKNRKSTITQQTKDFIWMLKYLLENGMESKSTYILFMEDDFTLCEHGLQALQYFISKSNDYSSDWIGLRCSYGLNGIIIKSRDLQLLYEFFKRNYDDAIQRAGSEYQAVMNRPPDHLIYEFMMSQKQNSNRQLIAFRYNLFYHIGDVSSVQGSGSSQRYIPKCYQLLYDWLQPNELFHNEDCPNDDIWPCTRDNQSHDKWKKIIDWDKSSTKELCRNHFPICDPSIARTEEEAIEKSCRLHR